MPNNRLAFVFVGCVAALVLSLTMALSLAGAATQLQKAAPGKAGPLPQQVAAKLQALFQKYYPKAAFTDRQADGVHAEYEVTTFEFPPADPAKKHENPIQRGPKKGGVLCSAYLEKGEYRGQLATSAQGGGQYEPWIIDRKAYTQLLMAPYSAKLDAHLWVSLEYPPDASREFLKEFRALMEDFEKDGAARQFQFVMAMNTSAKTLLEALPAPAKCANARLNDSVLTGSRRMPVKEAKPAVVQSSLRWITRVTNPTWLPENGISADSLILVRGEADTPDIVRATWQSHGSQIEVSQIATVLVVRLTPTRGTDMGRTLDEKMSVVKGACAQFFAGRELRNASSEGHPIKVPVKDVASRICDYSFKADNIKVFPDGIIGVPITRAQAGVRQPSDGEAVNAENRADNPSWDQTASSWSYWWRHVCWWHDGATIGFYFPKLEAGPIAMDSFTMGPLRWLDGVVWKRAKAFANTPAKAVTDMAEQFVDLMSRGEFDRATGCFDDRMKKAVPPTELKKIWDQLAKAGGRLQGRGQSRTETVCGEPDIVYVVHVPANWEHNKVDFKIVFDEQGRISGLWTVPPAAKTTSRAPRPRKPKPPTTGPPDTSGESDGPAFWPAIIERPLGFDPVKSTSYLKLDHGEYVAPETCDAIASYEEVRRKGVNLFVSGAENGPDSRTLRDVIVGELWETAWDDSAKWTPLEARSNIARNLSGREPVTGRVITASCTFAFTTREGNFGLFRLVKQTGTPVHVLVQIKRLWPGHLQPWPWPKSAEPPESSRKPAASASSALIPLADAVRVFNIGVHDDALGNDKPPLTEDEVVTAIRWALADSRTFHASDKTRKRLHEVAETRLLPPEYKLTGGHSSLGGDRMDATRWEVWLRLSPPKPAVVRHYASDHYPDEPSIIIRRRPMSSRLSRTKQRKVVQPNPKEPVPENMTKLDEAIRVFNAHAADDRIGRNQPPLTADEVIAAIRWFLMDHNGSPVSDKTLAALDQAARTRLLPPDFKLEVISQFQPNNEMEATVWSVRLRVPAKPEGQTTCVDIRWQPITSRVFGDEERKFIEKGQKKRAAEGRPSSADEDAYKSERAMASRLDVYGDPLPPGAIARLSTVPYRASQVGCPRALAFPDNKHVVGFTYNDPGRKSSFYWWDLTEGTVVRTVELADNLRNERLFDIACVMTPDGKIAAARIGQSSPAGGNSHAKYWVKWWEVDTGRQLASITFDDPAYVSQGFALSPDGSIIITSGPGGVRAWDRATQKQIAATDVAALAPSGHVVSVAISPAGKVAELVIDIGAARALCKVALWDWGDARAPRTVVGRTGTFEPAGGPFTPDGKMLAVAGQARDIQFLDARSGQLLRTLSTRDPVTMMTFSSDGKQLALRDKHEPGTRVTVWDLASDKPRHTLESPSRSTWCFAFSPDGRFLACAGQDFDIWDLSAEKRLKAPLVAKSSGVDAISFAQGGVIATVNTTVSEPIQLWEAGTGRLRTTIKCLPSWGPGNAQELAVSPDGKLLASFDGRATDAVRISDAATGKLARELAGRSNINNAPWMSFSADGKRLAAVSPDDKARVWNVANGRLRSECGLQLAQPTGPPDHPGERSDSRHTGYLLERVFFPDLDCVVVNGAMNGSGTIERDKFHALSLQSGKELRTFGDDGLEKFGMVMSPDGKRLLSEEYGSSQGKRDKRELRLWDVGSGTVIWRKGIACHDLATARSPLAISADGKRLAVSIHGDQSEIQLCDTATGNVLQSFRCGSRPLCMRFSANGSLLAAGMLDGTSLVWDVGGETSMRSSWR